MCPLQTHTQIDGHRLELYIRYIDIARAEVFGHTGHITIKYAQCLGGPPIPELEKGGGKHIKGHL